MHWGLSDPPFENATTDRKRAGDGAYLFDPDGDVRSFVQYPCRFGNCRDRLAGKVAVVAGYGDVGKGSAASLKGAGARVKVGANHPKTDTASRAFAQ